VGPTADGRIPVIMQERLKDIGQWLKINGEAIYGTRKSSVDKQKRTNQKVYFTSKNKETFCIFTQWTDAIEIYL
jgi:alpha-L-fucosidase